MTALGGTGGRDYYQELIFKAATLARVCPQDWQAFVEAFKVFSDSAAQQCVSSPVEQLQRMQGRAQQSAELATLLREAVSLADSIASKTARMRSV